MCVYWNVYIYIYIYIYINIRIHNFCSLSLFGVCLVMDRLPRPVPNLDTTNRTKSGSSEPLATHANAHIRRMLRDVMYVIFASVLYCHICVYIYIYILARLGAFLLLSLLLFVFLY